LNPLPAMPHTYRLRLPGPVTVPPRVQQACAGAVVNHRGPEFRARMAAIQERLQPLVGSSRPVLLFGSTGTGMMEASLVNTGAPREPVLVCVNGQFGERYASIARTLGMVVDVLEFPWGSPVVAEQVGEQLRKRDYRAVVVVHNESSTGTIADLKAIGEAVGLTNTLLIVDSVSGLGGMPMKQEAWGVDVLVSASQKALMCPPGLALASLSEKALAVVQREDRFPRFYWDFRRALPAINDNETPFTTPVSLATGLLESLQMMCEEGFENVLERHALLAEAFRRGCVALGFRIFGDPSLLSNTVVALEVPGGINGTDIVKHMREQHGTIIAGSRNRLQGRVIRVGTMGDFTLKDVLIDLALLEKTLVSLGLRVNEGAAVSAALAVAK
jgi:aspartate aminotransferase-like enzyme